MDKRMTKKDIENYTYNTDTIKHHKYDQRKWYPNQRFQQKVIEVKKS